MTQPEQAGQEERPVRKPALLSRRRLLRTAFWSAPLLALGDSLWMEPKWVRTQHVLLGADKPTHRVVHFTDVHHKGDRNYLAGVVRKINALSPDLVCFTGDLIEEMGYLAEALELLAGIKSPLYGVPGNHEYWSNAPFEPIAECFAGTGGAWLIDEQRTTADGRICISGTTCASHRRPLLPPKPSTRNIFLMHYPAWVKRLAPHRYDLLLAGHSHGGQVWLPFYGAAVVPYGVEEYARGLFHTAAGPLYVNPGIGWFWLPIRFNCRPEITVFDL